MLLALRLTDGVNYVPIPRNCMLRGISLSPVADCGVAGSATVEHGADTVMTADAAGAVAGDYVAGAADATNGRKKFVGGQDVMTITCSSTNNVEFGCVIDLDEYAVVPHPVGT